MLHKKIYLSDSTIIVALPRQFVAFGVPKTAGVLKIKFVDTGNETGRRNLRRNTSPTGHPGGHESGVKQGDRDPGRLEFMHQVHADLVNGCFRRAVAIVIARAVVGNRAYAARYDGDLGTFAEIVAKRLNDSQRTERIHLVLLEHVVVVDRPELVVDEYAGIINKYIQVRIAELVLQRRD